MVLGDHLLQLSLFLCLVCPAQGSCYPQFLFPSPLPPSPVGNLSQAMENVLSVLLFYPEDEAAKKALAQYQAQLGEPRPGLGPREVTPLPALPR